jgi:hypothetical protein
MSDYPEEVSLVNLIIASEENDETLVILNTHHNSPDKSSNEQSITAAKWASGT